MARQSRLLQWRAACPYCGSRFSRREYLHSGPRNCGACSAVLKPAEPANMIGNIAFGVPLGLSVVCILTYIGSVGAPTIEAKLTLAAVIVVVVGVQLLAGLWAWPYITPFAPPLWRCWNCNIELVHRFALCPNCGARAKPDANLRAAHVIPSGSVGSPATADSA